MVDVEDNKGSSRYEIFVSGVLVGFLTYRLDGDTVVLPHAEIDEAYGGRGLGQRLVETSLNQIRDSGRQIEPLCPFVQAYLDKHPDYQDLVKGR